MMTYNNYPNAGSILKLIPKKTPITAAVAACVWAVLTIVLQNFKCVKIWILYCNEKEIKISKISLLIIEAFY